MRTVAAVPLAYLYLLKEERAKRQGCFLNSHSIGVRSLFSLTPPPIPSHFQAVHEAIGTVKVSKMEEDRGSILTSNVLAFGIATFCFVTLRISFRLYTRKTSTSDWVLAVALVSRALPPTSHGGR